MSLLSRGCVCVCVGGFVWVGGAGISLFCDRPPYVKNHV